MLGLAAVLLAALLVPENFPALILFPADFFFFACLLGLMRFFTVLAALDTSSSFEGMGASREMFFSALAEPALLVALATLARQAGSLSLLDHFQPGIRRPLAATPVPCWRWSLRADDRAARRNSRIPVDDPNTHLELTMVHEVMVLDHGGPDLGNHPLRRRAEAVGAVGARRRDGRCLPQGHRGWTCAVLLVGDVSWSRSWWAWPNR